MTKPDLDAIDRSIRVAITALHAVMERNRVGSAAWIEASAAAYGLDEVLGEFGLRRSMAEQQERDAMRTAEVVA